MYIFWFDKKKTYMNLNKFCPIFAEEYNNECEYRLVPSEISQNEQKLFFLDFGVKNINLTNF